MIDIFATGRPAGAILSRTIRVSLGGAEYELPVRSIKANREWKETFNQRIAALIDNLEKADSEPETVQAVLSLLSNQIDDLIDLLVSYDTAGVLPSRETIEGIEPDPSLEVLAAVREVWRAANPLAATGLAAMDATPTNGSSEPTSSSPQPTAGSRKRSKRN